MNPTEPPAADRVENDVVASYADGAVVQLLGGDPARPDATVESVLPALVVLTTTTVQAVDDDGAFTWLLEDLEDVVHSSSETWTLLPVPGVPDFGVAVAKGSVEGFRAELARLIADLSTGAENAPVGAPDPDGPVGVEGRDGRRADAAPVVADPEVPGRGSETQDPGHAAPDPSARAESGHLPPPPMAFVTRDDLLAPGDPRPEPEGESGPSTMGQAPAIELGPSEGETPKDEDAPGRSLRGRARRLRHGSDAPVAATASPSLADLNALNVSAWFGTHHVLDRVSLYMAPGQVTALIGPSGCGKSTFLRILNRMHEMIPSASLSGEVLLDGGDIYDAQRKLTDARRQVGMVFQKPNPFPAMSIYDNVVASYRLTGTKIAKDAKDEAVESCLRKAGLWTEVRDRLRSPGGGLSGGQQQRLCIARALAIRPRVLLMDEPCSALDPTSTRRIEETIMELGSEVTIVIVTHNMQQAARVSDQCAFFLAEQGTPGVIVEHGPTDAMFHHPQDPRTHDYVNGRFG